MYMYNVLTGDLKQASVAFLGDRLKSLNGRGDLIGLDKYSSMCDWSDVTAGVSEKSVLQRFCPPFSLNI